ncbi:PadR family transcriptional regulator [Paenibacillus sp. HJGM_3]|uniref:PadR family transcriptional regulator n=1 Tax=Paenibacillus sp. HJGM_3 TaxID=3379816 RepID=UPI00385EA2DA
MNQLSNAEFLLLQLITEFSQASGYEVNKVIEQRGYREWANIGTTSIYIGLQKLHEKGLIRSEQAGKKSGKGPSPSRYVTTEVGMETLRREILHSLSATRERDTRFALGLAALPFIGREEAVAALQGRQHFLEEASSRIRQAYESQGGPNLPLHVRALFIQPMNLIESEQQFLVHLLHELTGDQAGPAYAD